MLASCEGDHLPVVPHEGGGRENLMIPADPLFPFQWFLRNFGQSGGISGIDINVVPAWDYATGLGISIVVNDTGIDYNNPDIAPNYNAPASRSLDSPFNDGYPYNGLGHGTSVAGLIAARNDSYGIVGVAFNATIASFRIIGTQADAFDSWTSTQKAFLNSTNFDVANNSWEFTNPLADSVFDQNAEVALLALLSAATNGRHGLGTINVFAAGNDFALGGDTNLHAFQSSINVVTVAALVADGSVNAPGGRYSTPGASILVSAPGTGLISDTIVGQGNLSDGNLSNGLNGTSFAAPLVSGVVALMLQANPQLGLRDVQEILAYTARITDSFDASWHFNDAVNWNGGGLHVSNDYGFGLVDARAAVALAQSWTAQQTINNRAPIASVDAQLVGYITPSGTSFTFNVPAAADRTLEWVRVQLNLSFNANNNLRIVLTSPGGASSVLLSQPDDGKGRSYFNNYVQLSSDQFWGQSATGTWTLSIGDANPLFGDSGFLSSATIVLVGDPPRAGKTYVYTDEYAVIAAADSTRTVLDDPGTTGDTLNAAAVSGSMVLNLAPGGTGTIAGARFAIGATTVITSAIGGAGNDTIRGNDYGDTLQGGAGNEVLIGGLGNDTIAGGAGTNAIDGGGGLNTARLPAPQASYQLTNSGGLVRVYGPGELDTLASMQYLSFAGVTVPLKDAVSKVGADSGGSSILWQNDDGTPAIWKVSGTALLSGKLQFDPGSNWHIAGRGDFNGLGWLDILLQNDDGTPAIWTTDGTNAVFGGGTIWNPGAAWHIRGTGDFDANGTSDILWQNDDGTPAIWQMNGIAITGGAILGLNPGPNWHIKGTADFYHDGKTDILWQNDGGSVAIWEMSGTTITAGGLVGLNPGPTWHVKGTGDFYRDGHPDILWQNDNGSVAIWEMDGTKIAAGGLVAFNPGSAWHVNGTGNFYGAESSGILWQNDDGSVAIWDMLGPAIIEGGVLGLNPGPSWHTIGSDGIRFINGTAGNGTLVATSEADEFVLTSYTPGSHAISGFNTARDVIELSRSKFASFSDVQAHSTSSSGSTLISLDSVSTLLLQAILPGSLHASNFAFG